MTVMASVFFTPLLRLYGARALGSTQQVFLLAAGLLLVVAAVLLFAGKGPKTHEQLTAS